MLEHLKNRRGFYTTLLLAFLVIAAIAYLKLPVTESESACISDSDCVLVRESCCTACLERAVSRKYNDYWEAQRTIACATGAMCDVIPPECQKFKAECDKNACVAVKIVE